MSLNLHRLPLNHSIEADAQRRINEKAFEATIRAYILDGETGQPRKYQFGGAHNFISTCKNAFEKLAEDFDCKEYAKVAEALAEVELMSDQFYEHGKEPE